MSPKSDPRSDPKRAPTVTPKVTQNWPLVWANMYGFSFVFTRKTETCAIMEREARKVQEKKYASKSNKQVRLSNATE